jgi:ferredoxin
MSSKKSSLKIIIDEQKCIGAASCVAIATNTFTLNSQNKAMLINSSADDNQTILLAAKSCPTNAITIIDSKTDKKLWPLD